MTEPEKTSRDPYDLISRGEKKPTPAGTLTFIGLRGLDPFIQYQILKHGLGAGILHKLGLQTLPQGLPAATGFALIDKIGLSPYRLILLSMATGSAVKQIIHMVFVSEQEMPTGSAIAIPLFNTIFNTLNTLFAIWTVTSPITSSNAQVTTVETLATNPLIAIGATAYFIGIIAEAVSEFQRKAFKANPANKGQPYAGGLFSLARNINYGAYTVWRAGYALASGGLSLGA